MPRSGFWLFHSGALGRSDGTSVVFTVKEQSHYLCHGVVLGDGRVHVWKQSLYKHPGLLSPPSSPRAALLTWQPHVS